MIEFNLKIIKKGESKVPIKRSSFKDVRRSKRRHVKNVSTKSELKTLVKNFEKLLTDKKVDAGRKDINEVISTISRAVTKGVLKKNTASRKISRLMKRLSGSAKA